MQTAQEGRQPADADEDPRPLQVKQLFNSTFIHPGTMQCMLMKASSVCGVRPPVLIFFRCGDVRTGDSRSALARAADRTVSGPHPRSRLPSGAFEGRSAVGRTEGSRVPSAFLRGIAAWAMHWRTRVPPCFSSSHVPLRAEKRCGSFSRRRGTAGSADHAIAFLKAACARRTGMPRGRRNGAIPCAQSSHVGASGVS